MNLVKTLQEVLRHAHSLGGEDTMRNILSTLKTQGTNFESVLTQSAENKEIRVSKGNPDQELCHVEGDTTSYDPMGFLSTSARDVKEIQDDSNHEGNLMNVDPIEISCSSRLVPEPAVSQSMDDYWNLNDYWNQVASILEEPVEQNVPSSLWTLDGQEHESTFDESYWESSLPNLHLQTGRPIAETGLDSCRSNTTAHESGLAIGSMLPGSNSQSESPHELGMWWDAFPDLTSNMDDLDSKALDFVPVS